MHRLDLLVLSTACLAEPNITILKTKPTVEAPRRYVTIPPPEYDYPYKGKLVVQTVTLEQLREQCSVATAMSLGCAFPSANSCRIILIDEYYIAARGWTKELMMRHELAHCNGWPGDHPGARKVYAGEPIPPIPSAKPITELAKPIHRMIRWYSA